MSDLQRLLEDQEYLAVRQMKNGEWIGVSVQIYTFGLCVGCDEFGYKQRYCYQHLTDAMMAAECYEGEGDPSGPWIKEKGENGERMGPGAKGIVGEGGFVDMQAVIFTLAGVFIVFLIGAMAYDVGKWRVFEDIKHYGCEVVVDVHEGKK